MKADELRAAIAAKQAERSKLVPHPIPEWGVTVWLHPLTLRESLRVDENKAGSTSPVRARCSRSGPCGTRTAIRSGRTTTRRGWPRCRGRPTSSPTSRPASGPSTSSDCRPPTWPTQKTARGRPGTPVRLPARPRIRNARVGAGRPDAGGRVRRLARPGGPRTVRVGARGLAGRAGGVRRVRPVGRQDEAARVVCRRAKAARGEGGRRRAERVRRLARSVCGVRRPGGAGGGRCRERQSDRPPCI
jgi:hypothetical protein